jgi:hypothetical protein
MCLAIEGKQKAYTQCLTTRKQASRNAFFSWIADDDKGKYNPQKNEMHKNNEGVCMVVYNKNTFFCKKANL